MLIIKDLAYHNNKNIKILIEFNFKILDKIFLKWFKIFLEIIKNH